MQEREPGETPFQKTVDERFEYRGYHSPGAVCRIRIFEKPGSVPVVIATELQENTNSSITNMAEYLAAEVIAKHFPHRFEEEQPVTWIEHYPPIGLYGKRGKTIEYSLVTFDTYRPRRVYRFGGPRIRIGQPSWRHMDESELHHLLGHVPTER